MLDVARDPRWGRIAESPGEDPYLGAAMGVAMVRGFQGKSLADPTSLAACAKHFAAYGAVEAGRDYNSAWLPEMQLRDVYLRPFHAVVDAGVASLMTSFSALNGVPATGNLFLLGAILRGEWAFRGGVSTPLGHEPEICKYEQLRERPGPFYVESDWTEEAAGTAARSDLASPAAARK